MDDFFKNIRSTPVNVGNLIEEPGVSGKFYDKVEK